MTDRCVTPRYLVRLQQPGVRLFVNLVQSWNTLTRAYPGNKALVALMDDGTFCATNHD
jgi:hypothetical protein